MKRLVLTTFIAAIIGALTLGSTAWAGGYGYRGHYGYGHHGSNGDELLAGLIIGGLFGWFLNEDRHYTKRHYDRRYYSHDYPRHTYHRRYDDNYGSYSTGTRYHTHTHSDHSMTRISSNVYGGCVMTREYTTTINIDGLDTAAYGTRCMKADGSWELGAPRLVPAN